MPTQSYKNKQLNFFMQLKETLLTSSQATTVGPFHKANGVPAFIASSSSSCLKWGKKFYAK
jgi:hypothetical protein